MDVLVTGASGFLGSEIIRHLLHNNQNQRIFAMVRSSGSMRATDKMQKIFRAWQRHFGYSDSFFARIQVIDQDLCAPISEANIAKLGGINLLIHAAAITDFSLPLSASRKHNVFSTQGALRIGRRARHLQRFIHVSSAFAAGRLRGVITEDMRAKRFQNTYEQTKRESEDCVRYAQLPYTIVRPSIIVGDSMSGYTLHFRVIYSLFRILFSGRVPRTPIDWQACGDIIPVDYVTKGILSLAQNPNAEGEVVHLCSGARSPSAREVFDCARRIFREPLPPPAPLWIARTLAAWPLRPLMPYELGQVLDAMVWHLPYMTTRNRVFCTNKAEAFLPDLAIPVFKEYGQRMIEFCTETAWGKRAALMKENQRLGDMPCLTLT